MALKDYMGHAIVFLMTSAVFFFLMIILISEGKVHHRNNKVNEGVTIKSVDYGRWGQIPGNFSVDYQRHVTPYTINSFDNDASSINLDKQDTFKYTIAKDLYKPIWSPIKSIIEYVESSVYTLQTEETLEKVAAAEETWDTFNFAAMSTWYEMTHKPRYWYAWSGLSQIANIMYQSPMINLYYSYNAFNYVFSDYEMVQTGVLASFNETTQSTIYNDELYGMNTSTALLNWCEAMIEKNATSSDLTVYNSIISYYQSINITDFNETTMDQIVGKGSLLWQILNTQHSKLLRYTPYAQKGDVDNQQIIQLQWGRADLFNADFLLLPGVQSQPSVGVEIISPMWSTYPEYGFVAQNWPVGDIDDNMLTQSQAVDLLEQSTESYQTLLNPLNMKEFYRMYEEGLFSSIATRFSLSTIQSDIMYTYLENMVDDFLFQNQDGPEMAMYGYLLSKSFSSSFDPLAEIMPIQTATRNMLVHTWNDTNDDTCYTMFKVGLRVSDNVTAFCDSYNNLASVDDMMFFINATWYCTNFTSECEYYGLVQNATGMSDDDMVTVYDYTNSGSFGYVLNEELTAISTQYNCSNASNCTDNTLAELQWGSSGVTLNPYQLNETYNPVTITIVNWSTGDYQISQFSNRAPELYYYTNAAGSNYNMTAAQVLQLESDVPLDFGVANYYNAERMTVAYFTNNASAVEVFNTVISYDLFAFVENMFTHIEDWLLHGSFDTMNSDQMINGYTNPIVDRIIGGDWEQGADFDLTDTVLPIFNYDKGAVSGQKFGVRTGAIDKNDICSIRFINDVAYINKYQTIYNGTGYTNVTQQPSLKTGHYTGQLFDMANIGIQFEPFLDKKDDETLRLYEPYTLQISEFKQSDTSEVGDEKLPMTTYSSSWPSGAIDIGFANNNYYQLASTGGSNLVATDTENAFSLQVDSSDYSFSSAADSIHEIVLQATTGYTYSTSYDYSVFLKVTAPEVQTPNTPAFPLQSISSIINVSIPMYDMVERQSADQDKFYDNQKYVAEADNSIHKATIAMIVCCVLTLVAGIAAIIGWKLRNKSVQEKRDQLIESEARRAEILENGNAYQ